MLQLGDINLLCLFHFVICFCSPSLRMVPTFSELMKQDMQGSPGLFPLSLLGEKQILSVFIHSFNLCSFSMTALELPFSCFPSVSLYIRFLTLAFV